MHQLTRPLAWRWHFLGAQLDELDSATSMVRWDSCQIRIISFIMMGFVSNMQWLAHMPAHTHGGWMRARRVQVVPHAGC